MDLESGGQGEDKIQANINFEENGYCNTDGSVLTIKAEKKKIERTKDLISSKIIKKAVRRLAEQFNPERIILFGSYARGTADDKSDIDLLVICPLKKKRIQLMSDMNKALEGLRLPRDIVVISPKEFGLEREIPGTIARYAWTEGKSLYEQNKRSN